MPGATTARLVVCASEMPIKLFMIPQTVPNSPTKGAVEPMKDLRRQVEQESGVEQKHKPSRAMAEH